MFSWLTNQEGNSYDRVTVVKGIQDTVELLDKIMRSMEQVAQTCKRMQDDHKLYMVTNNEVLENIKVRLDKMEDKEPKNWKL